MQLASDWSRRPPSGCRIGTAGSEVPGESASRSVAYRESGGAWDDTELLGQEHRVRVTEYRETGGKPPDGWMKRLTNVLFVRASADSGVTVPGFLFFRSWPSSFLVGCCRLSSA